jgi:hypothetical protein
MKNLCICQPHLVLRRLPVSLPSNLNPEEEAALRHLTEEVFGREGASDYLAKLRERPEAAEKWEQGRGGVQYQEDQGQAMPPLGYVNLAPQNYVNLETGIGRFDKYDLVLSEARLKDVRALCSEQVAADLKAEIARLNGKMPKV